MLCTKILSKTALNQFDQIMVIELISIRKMALCIVDYNDNRMSAINQMGPQSFKANNPREMKTAKLQYFRVSAFWDQAEHLNPSSHLLHWVSTP